MKVLELSAKVKNEEMRVTNTYGRLSVKSSMTILITLLICTVLLLVDAVLQPDNKRFEKIPEQIEHVEVIGRRMDFSRSGRTRIRTYIVAFKLADGAEKEFVVGTNGRRIYNALQNGVTGRLIYKEIESDDGAKNFRSHSRFISFEEDPGYGGELLKIAFINTLYFRTLLYFCLWFILLIVYAIFNIKGQAKYYKTPKQVTFVKIIRKRTSKENSITNYFITFKLPTGAEKVLLVGRNNSRVYDFVNEGDTGLLTYREQDNKLISCCFKKDPSVLDG